MKRSLFVLTLLLSSFSLGSEDIRLQMSKNPISMADEFLGSSLWVEAEGRVFKIVVINGQMKEVYVGQLSQTQMETMEDLIETSSLGENFTPEPSVCRAIPQESYSYSANNGEVVLQEGTRPCGSSLIHSSPSAIKLIALLDQLEKTSPNSLRLLLAD